MNNSFKCISLVASIILLSSCGSELYNDDNEPNNEANRTMFTAQQESLSNDGEVFGASAATRTTLAEDKSIHWTTGDAVNVYDGTSNSKFAVVAVDENDKTSCTFCATNVGVKKADNYVALYPYSLSANFSTSGSTTTISNLTLPTNQQATAGGFDPKCNLMVANYDAASSTLQFRHLCSYIKLSTTFDCSRIVITFSNTAAKLTGTFDVTIGTDGMPTIGNIKNDAGDKNVVRLLGDIKANTDYYIAVLPGTYTGGLTVTLEPKNAATMIDWTEKKINFSPFKRETSADVVMNRAKNKSFGTFNTSLEHEIVSHTYFEDLFGYGEMYNNGKNLPSKGKIVLWAKHNIGAGVETAPGSYFAWGEVSPRSTAYNKANYLCSDYYPVNLDLAHDAASVNYGLGWRTPSDEEFKHLKKNTIFVYSADPAGYYVYPADADGKYKNLQKLPDGHVYTISEGINGSRHLYDDNSDEAQYVRKLTTATAHIFLPFGGFKGEKDGIEVCSEGTEAFYWTNGRGNGILLSNNKVDYAAYYLGINGSTFNMNSYFKPRYYGFNIRPIFVYEW